MRDEVEREAEWIERQAVSDLGAAAHERGSDELITEPVAGALVVRSPGVDHPLVNRVLGLGVDPATTEAALDAMLEGYRSAGTSRFFVHLYDAAVPRELPAWLEARGIVRYRRSWEKLARGRLEPLPAVATPLAIRPATRGDVASVASIFGEGFDCGPAGHIFASAIGRPGWHGCVALDGAEVVAAGLLFIARDIGYLAGGATRREHRGKGAQRALLAQRCRVALDHGCRRIVSETGAPAPGDPQHSHRNLERCGLRVIAIRHNYAPQGTLWQHGTTD